MALTRVIGDGIGQVTDIKLGGSGSANTLDDYEEGTWTPSLGGNTTYTNRSGVYRKVGGLVFIFGVIQINTIGTGSTQVISGLPFTNLFYSKPFYRFPIFK